MRLNRRGKSKRIRPEDIALDEFSKINKGNTLRVMDRSKERSGEKISDETGLYVPKREPENYIIEKFSPQSVKDDILPKRESLLGVDKEDYNYGKMFAVGEQYIEKETVSTFEESEYDAYDNYEDTDDYSIDSIFAENETKVKVDVDYSPESTDDNIDNENSKETLENSFNEDISNNSDNTNISSFDKQISDNIGEYSSESLDKDKTLTEKENIQQASNYDSSSSLAGEERVDLINKGYDQAAELRRKTLTGDYKEENAENNQKRRGFFDMSADEEIDPQKEALLKEAIENIKGAASAKEKLAAQREAIRLGMVDVLVDSDHSEMVRPELLDEIGFTPGGDKKPEIVKNKRFRFGRKRKKNVNIQSTEELADKEIDKTESKIVSEKPADEVNNVKKEIQVKSERKSIANKQIDGNASKSIQKGRKKKSADVKERRSDIMKDDKKRREYIIKNRNRLVKAGNDLANMQEKYDSLTDCLNDLVLFNELPIDAEKNIRNTAAMVVKYRSEKETTRKNCVMDEDIYRRMNQSEEDIPGVIRRLAENEKYSNRIKSEIDRLEQEKEDCRDESSETEDNRRRTKNISIAVMIVTIVTMGILIILQTTFEADMQIPILLFGVCAILETLGIFVQHFKSETEETANHYKLNKLIKKQNSAKVKYVNSLNAVEYIYKKYDVHSSSELLFQWEGYQKAVKARENFLNAGKRLIYYEDRLKTIFGEYGFKNTQLWVSQAEYFVEEENLVQIKEEMAAKRSKLMGRMEKCKKVMGRLDGDISVLIIKFPQYADEINKIMNEM